MIASTPRAPEPVECAPSSRTRTLRTTMVISSLTSGGAERVMTTMANAWVARGHDISIITIDGPETPPYYPLDSAVRLSRLDRARPSPTPAHAAVANIDRVRTLRKTIAGRTPDVVISFLDTTNVLTLLATRGTGLPVIVAEHTDPSLKTMHPAWNTARSTLYPRASRVVVLSESARNYFPAGIQTKTVILPNPVMIDAPSGPVEMPPRPRIVAMGRFGPEKGFDQLLDAFALVAPAFPDWDLWIWGTAICGPT